MNKVRVLSIYYRQIAVVTLICSLLACKTIHDYGWGIFAVMFWFKVISGILALYLNNVFRNKELYFYYNAGINRRVLWGSILVIDTALFILLLVLFFQPK